jgi:hypothetical protein
LCISDLIATGTLIAAVFRSVFRRKALKDNTKSQTGTVERWNTLERFHARARIGVMVFHCSTVPDKYKINDYRDLGWNTQISKRSGSVPDGGLNKIWGWNG